MADYDLAIIGGGLNGVSVARDAAGRGLRVILLEQGDLGSAASSPTGPVRCAATAVAVCAQNCERC